MILFLYSVIVLLMILLPVALASAWRRRFDLPWWWFCVGMATFVASQVYHLPLNDWLTRLGVLGQMSPQSPDFPRTAVLLGLSAGLCESLARAAGYAALFRWLPQRHQPERWAQGALIGLGHGGIEAMILAVLTAAQVTALWGLQSTDLSTLGFPPEQVEFVGQQLAMFLQSPDRAFLPLLERGIAILIHVSLSVLVWAAFRRRQPALIAAAVLCHALFDSVAVYIGLRFQNAWLTEGVLLVMAVAVAAWAWRLRDKELAVRPQTKTAWLADLRMFGATLAKELKYQWATRRVIVVGVVFLVFGMGSPLLAYFTPQLLSSFEGAEMFADLIPTPTKVDAVGQYIKNLSQFGFIVAILLGMGAVAGEKERGTAALILSKPLPRWAFVAAKFAAQGLIYAAAFALAAVGAYYYTSFLFEPLELGPFLFGNLLLLAWLLCFAAVTLLGSVIAPTTGAAAGIGFGGAVLLLLASYLPKVGALMPNSLIGWRVGPSWVSWLDVQGVESLNRTG